MGNLLGSSSTSNPMYQSTILRPRTTLRFNSLMELYEKNYIQIRLLIPELKAMDASSAYVSKPEGLLPLEITGIEHSRYTSTFKLTYLFASESRQDREPDLSIRLYHDARTCEVMSGLIPSMRYELRRTRDLSDNYRLNRFLYKWVSYCMRQGHGFDLSNETTRVIPHKTGHSCAGSEPLR